jgi:uncharacterized protein (DUF1800 family)
MSTSRRRILAYGAGACLAALSGCALGPPSAFAAIPSGPFSTPQDAQGDGLHRLLNRCSFGVRPGDLAAARALRPGAAPAGEAWLSEQLRPETIDDDACERALRRFDSLDQPYGELYEYKERVLLRELTSATVLRAALSRRQLHEVMVNFWTDHFNIDISKGDCAWLKVGDDREVIRRHALGRFSDLLRASATSPAMLWYLDGRVNRRATSAERANENYARELLELHTLGVHGGYSQQDVMEAARCLTGWTVRPRSGFFKGRVEFAPGLHDDGEKTVLGRHFPAGGGAQDLERLVALVADHPATASHLAAKLCRRFIADEPPPAAVAAVATAFTASGGDISATLRTLFSCEEFRAAILPGGGYTPKFKRPFHFLVSILRACDASSDGAPALTAYLGRMGQTPFQFPTPDGYAEAMGAWTGTLMWRWQLARALSANRIAGTRIDHEDLHARAGSQQAVAAHLLGRLPTAAEAAALSSSADSLALLLSSPTFQRC